jgi:hypothetical protein
VEPYLPRSCRYDVNLPIRFFSSDGLATGRLLNVSDTGALVQFDRSVTIWTVGELSVRIGERYTNIKARAARVEGRQVGLTFVERDHNIRDILFLFDFAMEQALAATSPVESSASADVEACDGFPDGGITRAA